MAMSAISLHKITRLKPKHISISMRKVFKHHLVEKFVGLKGIRKPTPENKGEELNFWVLHQI